MDSNAQTYDVIVIGAGVAGCCTARELARYQLHCAVLEAGNDIANGTTRANSGLVHAGFDPVPNTLKARYNIEGSRLFPVWAHELGFEYQQNGALVLALDKEDLSTIETLKERAELNGVKGVRIISTEELLELEPHISPRVLGALLAPSAAICDPYGLAFAAAENAALNGVSFLFNQQVAAVTSIEHGGFHIKTENGDSFEAKVVINAAGLFADKINNLVSAHKLKITPVRGEYLVYDTPYRALFQHTVFQAPNELGKGVVVTPTVQGTLMVGPNAVKQGDKLDLSTSAEGLDFILTVAKKSWEEVSLKGVISSFAGLRAQGESGDFVIGEAPDALGFFNIACFESPGLASAPAVACDIAHQVANKLKAACRDDFNPLRHRKAPWLFASMNEKQRAQAIASNPQYGRVICRCCNVTEAEIVAELHSVLPVLSIDALKWRVGIMMGRCHGGFCLPELLSIFARETNLLPQEIDKRLPGSKMLAACNPEYIRRKADRLAALADDTATEVDHPIALSEQPDIQAEQKTHSLDTATVYDVIVIGGGAAGLAAAGTAAAGLADADVAAASKSSSPNNSSPNSDPPSSGSPRVLLIDRENGLGGILKQCIHNGFGLHRFKEELTGPEYATRELLGLTEHGVEIMQQTTVLSIHAKNDKAAGRHSEFHTVLAVNKQGFHTLSTRSIVLATGSRERGQGALGMCGSRPSGVFSAGSAQNIINLQGCLPGMKAVILGSGDIGLIMARRMIFQGANVLGVYEMMPQPSGLRRNIVQCLEDFGIPLHLSKTVTRLEGDRRLEAVYISDVDPQTLEVIAGTEQRVACDTLLLSVGLLPENEVAKTANVSIDTITGGACVDNRLSTDVAGIFACGNALHIHDLVDYASAEGEIAGAEAAAYAIRQKTYKDFDPSTAKTHHAEQDLSPVTCPVFPTEGIRYVVPQRIDPHTSAAVDVFLSFRVSRLLERARFVVEGIDRDGTAHLIKRVGTKVAIPAEMIQIKLKGGDVTGYKSLRLRIENRPSPLNVGQHKKKESKDPGKPSSLSPAAKDSQGGET